MLDEASFYAITYIEMVGKVFIVPTIKNGEEICILMFVFFFITK